MPWFLQIAGGLCYEPWSHGIFVFKGGSISARGLKGVGCPKKED